MSEPKKATAADRGFWNGGSRSHHADDQSSGRRSGYPGTHKPSRQGLNTDLEQPGETKGGGKLNSKERGR